MIVSHDSIETSLIYVRSEAGEMIELPEDSNGRLSDIQKYYPNRFTFVAGATRPVIGRLLDHETGEPVSGVTVEGYRTRTHATGGSMPPQAVRDVSADDGSFRLVGFPIGKSELRIRPPEGSAYMIGGVSMTTRSEDKDVTRDIKMRKGVIQRGRIVESGTDKPVAGYFEYWTMKENAAVAETPMLKRGDQRSRYRADAEGNFEIPVLLGRGILTFMADDDQRFQRGAGAEAITWSPEPDFYGAIYKTYPHYLMAKNRHYLAPIELETGEVPEPMNIQLDAGVTIPVTITGVDGTPKKNVYFSGQRPFGGWRESHYDGLFVHGYEPEVGRNVMVYHPASESMAAIALKGRAPKSLELKLTPSGRVTGRVVDDAGEPIRGAVIYNGGESYQARDDIGSELSMFPYRIDGKPLLTDQNGRFSIGGLMPGKKYAGKATARSKPTNRTLGELFADVMVSAGQTKDLGDLVPMPAKPRPSKKTSASISGRVVSPSGKPIAGAKIWLAVTSYEFNSEANLENRQGLLRELGSADQQGRFECALDAETTREIRTRPRFALTQLVATAQGYGLGWMPLEVFEDNSTPSTQRDLLLTRIDEALGDGRFASRTLELRPESQPVRGRLVDLEGNRLPNVTVLVESLCQPDIPQLLNALDKSWTQGVHGAINATGIVRGLARSELQRFIPPVKTDEKGEFEIRGIGDDQLVTLVFAADHVDARPLHVLGREMQTVNLPHIRQYPGGTQDMFVGRDFAYAVSPSIPVEGIVTDYDTGQPVPHVLVSVERLFRDEGAQSRLDTHHMRAVTDQHGRFRIIGMPPGDGHIIEAIPPKSEPYLPAQHKVSLSLEDGKAKQIKIQVKRGLWIEGRITDKPSGEPRAAAVDYMALSKNPHTLGIPGMDRKLGLDPVRFHQRYVTDSDGHYRVLGLPGPGVLLVTSLVPGYPLAAGAETIDDYDPSVATLPTTPFRVPVSNWHLLQQIDPAPNKDVEAGSYVSDLTLDSGLSIPGRAVGPEGKTVTDLQVLGLTEADQYWSPKYQDKVRLTDRFTVNGYDGKGPRQLFFKTQDESLVGQYRLEGDAPEEIVVTLEPSVRVTGRLMESKTDLPAPRYFLACKECLLSNEEYPPVKFMIHWCHTDDEGHFEIKGLMAGLNYKMYALSESNSMNKGNDFTIDLTTSKPGETIKLGDVPGAGSKGDSKD